MGQENELTPHSQLEPQFALHGIAKAAVDESAEGKPPRSSKPRI